MKNIYEKVTEFTPVRGIGFKPTGRIIFEESIYLFGRRIKHFKLNDLKIDDKKFKNIILESEYNNEPKNRVIVKGFRK